MPRRAIRLGEVPSEVAEGIQRLRHRLELPSGFPVEVLEEAASLRDGTPSFPRHEDRTDIEFVTVDPATSKDLDQAVCIERSGSGYRVHYAIADVAAWITPGSALDKEARLRGETLYAPGARVPLHPSDLSEDAGSLLADGRARPVILWTHELDADAVATAVTVSRAMVRSRAKLSYEEVARDLERGQAHPSIALLPRVGERRLRLEQARGGVSLNLPDQEIVAENGTWRTEFRTLLPVEDFNAQISLMTGMAAAQLMVQAGVGVLRTLPEAGERDISRLRWTARTLRVPWPKGMSYPEFVRNLDPADPRQLAVLVRCTSLFRGAGYVSFHEGRPEGDLGHAALATEYTHVTAPLRRLVDRFTSEISVCLAQGEEIPDWVTQALPELPEVMSVSGRRARAWERGVVDLAEALVLRSRVGEAFDAVLTDVSPRTGLGTFQIADPAVEARLPAEGRKPGSTLRVRVDEVDLVEGTVRFSHPQ
ncbi:RNB domain-containing ribonuclease [Arachnia propionica]|uniref:RNB domain-containing ribonuclease n=1 Tax=Arachnia propionica TaxID=1750 RepID=A0A3P1T8Y0_9ACTN|nr:RNB domain-containing ribonuclease [Arachnia propionica]RRD05819.1 RNB domain-containing ribonuclease [Arachnia propionica]